MFSSAPQAYGDDSRIGRQPRYSDDKPGRRSRRSYSDDESDDSYTNYHSRTKDYKARSQHAGLPYPMEDAPDGSRSGSRYVDRYDDYVPNLDHAVMRHPDGQDRQDSSQVPGSFPENSPRHRRERRWHTETEAAEDYRDRNSQVNQTKQGAGGNERLMHLPQKYSRRYREDTNKQPDADSSDQAPQGPEAMALVPRYQDKYDEPSDSDTPKRRHRRPETTSHLSKQNTDVKKKSASSKDSSSFLKPSSRGNQRDGSRDRSRERSRDGKDRSKDRDRSRDVSQDRRTARHEDNTGDDYRKRYGPEFENQSRDEKKRKPRSNQHDAPYFANEPQDSAGLGSRLSTLSIGPAATVGALSAAPGSPLLESYRGTYQSCSPMPSPMLLAANHPQDINLQNDISPINSDVEGDGKKQARRARFHDPEDIASRLARALRGDKPPDTRPLIEILPSLTHDQMMDLRADYKKLVKTGSERKGVNIAKHIRARMKDEDPVLMKACYATSLGQWESEAYWANFWYQGDKTRRELLIETLMGRTNEEIRLIKAAFTDKKYDNSLTKCMKVELKEDKFKKAVLSVLEERRMDDFDSRGRQLPLDYDLVDEDAQNLRRAVKADKGGESLMISIIIQRSESHLRAVLKTYEERYHNNFAREALKKSGNLVGELLAHILNGVINRPVRDALLLHHALTATKQDTLRRELLVSRLVRYHWSASHMQAVKRAYQTRYGQGLQDAVRNATEGAWGEFCSELCIRRMPGDIRQLEREV